MHQPQSQPPPPAYDDSAWPIVRVIPPPAGSTPEQFKSHLDNIERAFVRGQPFVLLVDARNSPPLNPLERRMVADRVHKNQLESRGNLRGMAIVLSSRFQRGVFTAVQWLSRPVYPIAAFESVEEASVWLTTRLERSAER